MYETYWGLVEPAFRDSLETRWFFSSPQHDEALARLFYVIEQRRGCGLLLGCAGTGKSLLLRVLTKQLQRTGRQVALVDALGLDAEELLWQLAAALRLAPSETDTRLRLRCGIQNHLRGLQLSSLQAVLIFDHVDRADARTLQMLERLSRLDDFSGSSITMIFASRSTHDAEASSALVEMADLRIELPALDRVETELFVRDRLSTAGCDRELFNRPALDALTERSSGIPREIVRLCDLSLLAAMTEDQAVIGADVVNRAALELQPRRRTDPVPEVESLGV